MHCNLSDGRLESCSPIVDEMLRLVGDEVMGLLVDIVVDIDQIPTILFTVFSCKMWLMINDVSWSCCDSSAKMFHMYSKPIWTWHCERKLPTHQILLP